MSDDEWMEGVYVGPDGNLAGDSEDEAMASDEWSRDEMSGDGDDEDEEDRGTTEQPKAKKPKQSQAGPKVDGRIASAARKGAKHPEYNRYKRSNALAYDIGGQLSLRGDIKILTLAKILIGLSAEERAELRTTGPMLQEWYLAKRETVTFLEERCFNALNAIDIRSCEAMAVRTMQRIVERLCCDEAGKRIALGEAPSTKGEYNPLTQKSNFEQGIKPDKKLYVPRVFPHHAKVVAAADRVLDGRRLFLAVDFDGAAWDVTRMASDLLGMLAGDDNLIALPAGEMRVLQLIYDGHGFTSASGAVRFTLRSPHTKRDHNATRNAFDPIFFIGTDKHLYLEKAVAIGGEESLRSVAYKGLTVTPPSEDKKKNLPQSVKENEYNNDLADLLCTE